MSLHWRLSPTSKERYDGHAKGRTVQPVFFKHTRFRPAVPPSRLTPRRGSLHRYNIASSGQLVAPPHSLRTKLSGPRVGGSSGFSWLRDAQGWSSRPSALPYFRGLQPPFTPPTCCQKPARGRPQPMMGHCRHITKNVTRYSHEKAVCERITFDAIHPLPDPSRLRHAGQRAIDDG